MIASTDDLVRAAMALRDEATMIDGTVKAARAPLSYGVQHLAERRDSLKRAADYLDQQAKELQAVAA